MYQMKLKDLLLGIAEVRVERDCLVTGITLDSRQAKSGDLFLACIGTDVDGRAFISAAISSGVVAVLCDDSLPNITLPQAVPIILVPGLRLQMGKIAAKFYGYPARSMTMIGVTGTNGKTSVTQYIATILNELKIPCGVIGTIGAGFPGKSDAAINTTPDPVTLQRLLAEFKEQGAKVVAMEASSHGLAQGRLSGIQFTIAVFTNLTREHLDYHGTMANYGGAKAALFLHYGVKYAVINADDDFGNDLIKQLTPKMAVYAYTTSERSFPSVPTFKACDIKLKSTAMLAQVFMPDGKAQLKSKLLGRFNLGNLLAVFAVLRVLKLKVDDILAGIEALEPVAGRMQLLGGKQHQPLVVVDYAHTPDALEKVLLTLREYCSGNLWCVFGCGGERDRGKRPLMGKIAELHSDRVMITNDNPRGEEQKQIVDDILQGLSCPWAAEMEYDRAVAIAYVINHAAAKDIILLAGKGHEDYQIIGREKIPFNDRDVALEVLSRREQNCSSN